MPTVSVILPTFGRCNTLARAIDSVLHQTYADIEVIVVDDNDPNSVARTNVETLMVKYSHDARVVYIQHAAHRNGSVARNSGIKRSSGYYLSFLDDDDYYLPNRIEKLVDLLKCHTEYDGAYSSCIITEGRYVVAIKRAELSGSFQTELLQERFEVFTGSNLFLTKSCIRDLGGFDESFERHQDLEILVRFFAKYQLAASADVLVVKDNGVRRFLPPARKVLEIKQNYFGQLSTYIDQLNAEGRRLLYKTHYFDVLVACARDHDFRFMSQVLQEFHVYGHLTFIDRRRLVLSVIGSFNVTRFARAFVMDILARRNLMRMGDCCWLRSST